MSNPSGGPDKRSAVPLSPGKSFGRYAIEDLLGEGGMGRVYRAFDTRLGRRVALKVIAATGSGSQSADQAARFLREARAGAALDHPNAVAIFDMGELDGVSFIAMELVIGHSLRKYIGLDSIGWRQRIRWLMEIAGALEAAHRKGLIHRDIKPDNVMIRSDGHVKVLDFGIARRMASAPAPTAPTEPPSITLEGGVLGTPLYMAPEQLHGEPLDGRADQFSWAVVGYELFTGKPPWGGDTVAIISQILAKEPAPIRAVLPDLPASIEATILRALAKPKTARFDSMTDVIRLLEPFAAGATESGALLPAPALSLSGATSRQARPARSPSRKAIVVFSVTAMLALCITVIAVTFRSTANAPVPPVPTTATSAPAPLPTAITALPMPSAANSEALAAYREGMQGLRDAAWDHVAHPAFQRAVQIDPSFAAAYLRLAVTRIHDTPHRIEQQEIFQKALSLRSALSERDQVLLDALRPLFQRDPPNSSEAATRLQAASRRYPGDAEFLRLAVMFKDSAGPHEQLDIAERCLAIDPLYADCWQAKARALARLERTPEALQAFTHCLEVSPAANDCLVDRSLLRRWTGQCAQFEEDVRNRIANDPKSAFAYSDLGMVLHKLGRPALAVRAALDQAERLSDEPMRSRAALVNRWAISISEGRLHDAEQAALGWRRHVAANPSETEHWGPARALVEIYQETGRPRQAAQAAGDFLSRRDAWSKPIVPSIWSDATLLFLKTQLDAGEISKQDYAARRSEWLRTWESTLAEDMRGAAWIMGYALPASTAEDAAEAIQAQPALMPGVYYWVSAINADALIGKVYFLAGQPDKALPYLTRATADCGMLFSPFRPTIAHYYLGAAREAGGDTKGACAAYQWLFNRWGHATPRALTAEKARARFQAIGCKP